MGEFINVLVSKGKSNLIPEKDNLYGQFVGEWDFEWVDNQGTTGERHVQGEWIFAWVLEGTAIQDVFICPSRKARIKDYQPDAAYATAVRMYNPNTEAWDILYTELGGATQLEGKREGNRIVQTEINEKNIQWVFSEITTTSFRWQRMVKRPDGTWETEAELLPFVDDYCRILRFVRKQKILIPFGNQDFTVFCFSSKWCHQESNNTIQSPNLQYFNIFGKIPEPLNQPYAKFTNFR